MFLFCVMYGCGFAVLWFAAYWFGCLCIVDSMYLVACSLPGLAIWFVSLFRCFVAMGLVDCACLVGLLIGV